MTTSFYPTPRAAATAAHLVSSQPVARASKAPAKAPWIESGFVQIPVEFFCHAIQCLSKGAARLYLVHCKHARTTGEGAGLSYCYRETLARELGCSLSTVDRGNAELEKHGLIRDAGRRFAHGGAVVFELAPPSKWTFPQRKSASSIPQKRAAKDAKTRPITKDKKQPKPKQQQTASPVVVEKQAEAVGSAPQETAQVPTEVAQVPTEVAVVVSCLEAQGVQAQLALHWVTSYGENACRYQLERLGRQKSVRNRTGWLRSALLRGDKDTGAASPQAVSSPAAKPVVPPELSPEEQAQHKKRKREQECQDEHVAQQVLATLDVKKQAYVLGCVEREHTTLARVIRREENYAFTKIIRQRAQ